MKLRLGTRGSDLALAQARWTARALERAGAEVELIVISTAGDRSDAPTFGAIGPQGVFVKEIEQTLGENGIDLAVHSCKDLPTRSPDGLTVAAVPQRADPADYLLVADGAWDEAAPGALPLGNGAVVGTSSSRRQLWLRSLRGDLQIQPLRGNVPTRIRRVRQRDYDAIVLANAGIERLRESMSEFDTALTGVRLVRLDPEMFVPAPAQGALALQCRTDDSATRDLLGALDDPITHACVDAERALLARAEGGCDAAFGAWCRHESGSYRLTAMADGDGSLRRASAADADAATLVDAAWSQLSQAGPAA